MLKKIGMGVAAVLVVLVLVIATRPSEFALKRATTIAAPPEAVFAQVNDFHKWEAWSPWAKLDPSMKATYAGAAAGVGAQYSWEGNDKVGSGRMTIEKATPVTQLDVKIEFLKPFEATNHAVFDLKPSGAGTEVTWTMSGHNNFMSKAFCLVMDMDKMVGPDFERGLASLKTVAESAPRP